MSTETVEASHVYIKELTRDLEAFVSTHPGARVTHASSEKYRLIAWMVHAGRESRLFSVRVGNLSDLKTSMIDPRSPRTQLLKTKSGRAALAEAWEEGQTVDFGMWKPSVTPSSRAAG